ncbi:SDR family NAD(P)-dependent oxidoreductase [Erythrobacter sp. GH1-10]|uniref:SDR family NAD(P)-dependent oxidoreductase n=1 Tax=Erythrobacter sp. GH1-10 TaxID=3349334 RepID=UPI00387823CC
MTEFAPRTAVITGGASGIGLGIARRLAGQGVQVMVADLPTPAIERAEAIDGITTFPCDVSELEQVESLADAAFATFETVDLVLNNAGESGPNGKLWEVDPELARAHFDVNYWGVWNGCRAFAPRLIAQESASAIYNTGSENSFFCAVPHSAAYIAAKHAVLGLTESFREDLPAHVHAGLIVPGWVFTPLGPERFMKFGMDVDHYVDIVLPQILARRRFVVSHGYNRVRIAERMDELASSFAEYALPSEEDAQHDVRLVMKQLRQP